MCPLPTGIVSQSVSTLLFGIKHLNNLCFILMSIIVLFKMFYFNIHNVFFYPSQKFRKNRLSKLLLISVKKCVVLLK